MPLWFRGYNEAVDDRKFIHIGLSVGLPQVAVLGAWWVMLALANNSTNRGYLVVDAETKLSRLSLINELERGGLEGKTARILFDKFVSHGLIAWDEEAETYWIPSFLSRNYASDVSTERVQRFRQRQATARERAGNADETAVKRSRKLTESESESESESETEAESQTNKHGACGAVLTEPGLIAFLAEQGVDDPEGLSEVWGWEEDDTRRYFRMFEYGDPAVRDIENPIGYAIYLQGKGTGPPQPRARDPDDRTRFAGPGVES